MIEWLKVSESLPQESEVVLCYWEEFADDSGPPSQCWDVAWYLGGAWHPVGNGPDFPAPSHWSRLSHPHATP